jgi:hypothetical protein
MKRGFILRFNRSFPRDVCIIIRGIMGRGWCLPQAVERISLL